MRPVLAELFGTFVLVFAGTAAIVIDQTTGGAVTHVGVALTFGLVVMALIYSLGEVSGAHLNPAVTLGFCVAGRFPARKVVPYILFQCGGAIAASLVVRAMFPQSAALGATLPSGSALQSAGLEVILANVLMFVILSVSTGAKEKGVMAGTAVGAVVAREALLAGPISGALLAVLVCRCVQRPSCCGAVGESCA